MPSKKFVTDSLVELRIQNSINKRGTHLYIARKSQEENRNAFWSDWLQNDFEMNV